MNVLSIDFDWIMEPSIEAYNHISNTDRFGPLRTWEKIKAIIPGFDPQCDLSKFHDLFFLLLDKSKKLKQEDICISFNHEEIYNFLSDYDNINLYNVDHHHDMGYPQNGSEEIQDYINCANWVYHLNKNNKLKSYTWIHNINSIQNNNIENFCTYIDTNDLDILKNIEFDKIFICASWEWVPIKYEPLFDVLISSVDKR